MGDFVPTHLLVIESVDDTELPINGVKNPVYIPKVGEVFTYKDVSFDENNNKTETLYKLEVVSRKLEVQIFMGPEQIVTIEVRKVE